MSAVLTAVAILAAFPAPVSAEGFSVPIELAEGATIDLVVEKTTGEVRDAQGRPAASATFRYRQTLTPEGRGYRVRQVMTGASFPPGVQPSQQENQILAAASEISYLTDEALTPVEIVDWPTTIDRILELIAKASPEKFKASMSQVRQLFMSMGPEVAAQVLLKEQSTLAVPQMLGIDQGEMIEERQQVPNPLGGPPIDSLFRVELVSIDQATSRAVIRSTQTLDPASARRSMEAAMGDVVKAGGAKSVPKDLRMDRTLVCAYAVDLKTGLTAKAACDMKTTTVADGKTGVRTERTVITQTLVSQP